MTNIIVVVVLFSIALCFNEYEEYLKRRSQLIELDRTSHFASNITLSPLENQVNLILLKYKTQEIERAIKEHKFPPAQKFFAVKDQIENESTIYKILKRFPKGALLHLHFDASGNVSWLIKHATYRNDSFMYTKDDGKWLKGQMKIFIPGTEPGGWVPIPELRQMSGNAEKFDQDIYDFITLGLKDMNGETSVRWKIFQKYFIYVEGLLQFVTLFVTDDCRFVPIFEEYFRHVIQTFIEDNIQYSEFGGLIPTWDYSRNYSTEDAIDLILNLNNEQVRKYNQSFMGIRVIRDTLRYLETEVIEASMREVLALRLNPKFKDFVIGFDLVGEEDSSLILPHVKSILKIQKEAAAKNTTFPLYLHGGETNWPVTNLFDLFLLGAKRINHGYNLFRYPFLKKLIKEKQICITVTPVSNQVLGYLEDLRNHPVISYLNSGLNIVLGSDDPAVYHYTGVTHDFYAAFMAWDLDLAGIKQLALNSIRCSAISDKEKFYKMWQNKYTEFLHYVIENF